MRITGAFHAGVTVADLDASLKFYRDILNMELVDDVAEYRKPWIKRIVDLPEVGGIAIAFLKLPESEFYIELLQYLDADTTPLKLRPQDPGGSHICFYVDEIERWVEVLREEGVPLLSDSPITIEEGPAKGSKVLYARDPDGYFVELFELSELSVGDI